METPGSAHSCSSVLGPGAGAATDRPELVESRQGDRGCRKAGWKGQMQGRGYKSQRMLGETVWSRWGEEVYGRGKGTGVNNGRRLWEEGRVQKQQKIGEGRGFRGQRLWRQKL